MASRPFSTVLLEMFNSTHGANQTKGPVDQTDGCAEQKVTAATKAVEPTPISFEPCFGSNIGVLSLFVQLPGRPNLAIGSALISLNEDVTTASTAHGSVEDLKTTDQ